jgi:hypothetical protein
MNRRGFLLTLCLTAGRSFAAAFLAPRIAGAGICCRCTARERLYSGLAQKGQTQQQKSDCEEALHEQASSVWLRHSLAKCKLCRFSRFLAAIPFEERNGLDALAQLPSLPRTAVSPRGFQAAMYFLSTFSNAPYYPYLRSLLAVFCGLSEESAGTWL